MADDTAKSLNLLSSLSTAFTRLRGEVQGLKSDTNGWSNSLGSALQKFGGRGGGGSSNLLAAAPVFSVTGSGTVIPPGGGPGSNLVFAQPAGLPAVPGGPQYAYATPIPPNNGGGGFDYRRAAFAGSVGGIQAMPGTKEAVEYQLGTARMTLYGQQLSYAAGAGAQPFANNPISGIFGNLRGENAQAYKQATALLQDLNTRGTVTGKFDTLKAMEAARQYGIGGPNFAAVAQGAAEMSNLTPGIGVEGSMRAYGALQQARNVNMLRGIGIQIRGIDGTMKPMPQIIDEIWVKLQREGMAGDRITVQDLQIALQPGNSIANLLDQYFGNDPLLRKQVEDGLLAKARSGGKSFAKGGLKKIAEETGASTAATSSLSQRIAESTKTLQQIAPAASSAFTFANRILSNISGFFNLIDRFTGLLKGVSFLKAGGDTLASGGNFGIGNMFNFMTGGVAGILGKLFGRAEGGPVGEQTPYIVGERGPELFVPKVSGTIIPNHELNNFPFRAEGGEVKSKKDWTADEFATRLAQGLGVTKPSAEAIDALKTWMRFEGGHWKNTADYNPLNTTLSRPGAKSMNSVGVKAYASWEQGLDATISTLTGPKAEARGYTALVEAIKKGNKEAILTAVNNSAWRTGRADGSGAYKGMADSSGGDYGSGGRDKVSNNFSGGGSEGGRIKLGDLLKSGTGETGNFLSSLLKGQEGTGSKGATNNTYNYGGVTVQLSGGGSPEANVQALKAALANSETLSKAANS